jgi:lipoprotein NlpD
MWTDRRVFRRPVLVPLMLACTVLFGGCASQAPAPIEQKAASGQQARPPAKRETSNAVAQPAPGARGSYRVASGDTLYSIAFRFGVDHRQLAQWNRIENPNRIFVGQTLRLSPQSAASPAPRRAEAVATPLPAPPPAPARPVAVAPPASDNKQATSMVATVGGSRTVNGVTWSWPAAGKARRAVAASGSEGLEILGSRGQPVAAAAAGQVVYSGNGLRGYGELIIIKHNDIFLSAYAHNDKRLVNEGASVKAGQQIAQMGDSEASEVMVHFEIRKSGKAVSPLQFLPQR